ncbi:MAG: hypothetical protein ACREJC_21080 [Tepidisphaeraceae bacterium]
MHILTQWEQSPTFDPYNPNQIIREPNNIGIPGGAYGSFYFNKQPTTVGQVLGGLSGGLSSLPPWAQAAVVGGLAAVGGYYGMKYVGPKVGLSGLAGPRRRRRRA